MAKIVELVVTKGAGIVSYFILVDGVRKKLVNHRVSISLSSGKHLLHWFMTGNSGSNLSIKINCEGATLYDKSDKVPADEKQGGGSDRFVVPEAV